MYNCLSDQIFSPSRCDCNFVSVLLLTSALPVPRWHDDVLTAVGPRVGWRVGGGLTSLVLGHNATVTIVQLEVNLNHLFFLEKWPPYRYSQDFTPHTRWYGQEGCQLLTQVSSWLTAKRCRLTNPVVAEWQLWSPLLINTAAQNELCSLSHRDTCECLLSFHMALAQLTRICVSWLSRFA